MRHVAAVGLLMLASLILSCGCSGNKDAQPPVKIVTKFETGNNKGLPAPPGLQKLPGTPK